jgi:hypothetical protein
MCLDLTLEVGKRIRTQVSDVRLEVRRSTTFTNIPHLILIWQRNMLTTGNSCFWLAEGPGGRLIKVVDLLTSSLTSLT